MSRHGQVTEPREAIHVGRESCCKGRPPFGTKPRELSGSGGLEKDLEKVVTLSAGCSNSLLGSTLSKCSTNFNKTPFQVRQL